MILVYNVYRRSNPIRQELFMVFTPAVVPYLYIHRQLCRVCERRGMLMKSKHCTYGKKANFSIFCNNHLNDIISHKSTIAASDTGSYR